ncbi:hypothetical protein HYO65_gp177 [Tenacibaculum phage PTm1]|nr:hypothetical protein HYO65_gp177 [Tenacibaculum phage PTm1]BBI90569.1 hypothetical protein [Tenacibaculum phage PTm1]
MFITQDNRILNNNDTLYFENTSVGLSSSRNVYLVSDTKLTSLQIKYKLDDSFSNDFKIYSLNRWSYTITITTGTVVAGTFSVHGHSITVTATDTPTTVASKLKTVMDSSNKYYSVSVNAGVVTVIPTQSGQTVDNHLSNGTTTSNGITFDTAGVAPTDILTIVSEQNLTNVDYFERSGKHVYKINLLFSPQYETGVHDEQYSFAHNSQVDIVYNNGTAKTHSIKVNGRCQHIDGKLTVALQNFKKYLNEDYYQAFFDSKLNTNEQDQVLLNRKKREYLMVMFEMTGFIGAYKSLLTAIEYFGWGQLLELKEYWKSISSNQYKLTSIKNQVLDKIDKQLTGFKKSNQMSLTYKVNDFKGNFDSDGLPIYENVLTDTDTVITKLYSLKAVLECDFLTLNTKIFDITGEIQAVVGHELNIWLNSSTITDVRLNENVNSDIEWSVKDKVIDIEEHQVIVDAFAFETDNTTAGSEKLKFLTPTPTSTAFNKTYFDVLKVLDDTSTLADFEYATQYARLDFGLIELDVTKIETSLYTSFRYLVYLWGSTTELFKSNTKPISQLGGGIKCGIQKVGSFRLVLALFDHYGGMSVVGLNEAIQVRNKPINFRIAKHSIVDTAGEYKDLRLHSTMEDLVSTDTDKSNVVDSISETLDVNTYNPLTNMPTMTVLKHYETKFDMHSVYSQVRELNSIPATKTKGLPVSIWGYKYGTMIYDIIGNGNQGNRYLRLRLFDHHNWSEVSLSYDTTTYPTPERFLIRFIELLNGQPSTSPFAKFTYDINYYSNNPQGNQSDGRPMLRIKAKEPSFTLNMFSYDVQKSFAHTDFTGAIDTTDIMIFSTVDTSNIIQHNGRNTRSNLVVKVGSKTLTMDKPYANIDELITDLDAWRTAQSVKELSYWKGDSNTLVVTCQADFSLKHNQFGHYVDIFRGAVGTRLEYIQDGTDIKLGEPVYAFVDDNSKLNSANVSWVLKDSLTNQVITTQYAQAFRYVMVKQGSFTLECTSTDKYGTTTTIKQGVYLVDMV